MDINIINDNNKEALDNRLVDYHSFAFREQYKIVWRLFKTYKSPLVYNRFKALFYAHSKPNNKDEEEFVNICNLYTKLLNKEISVDDYIKNYSDKKFDFEFEGDVISFLNKCFKELLKVYDGKYFYVFLTLNGILNNLGIVLGTYGEKDIPYIETLDEPSLGEFIYKQLLNAKLFTKEYVNNLRELSLEDVKKGIKEVLGKNEKISKVYIFGSFAREWVLIDSDIDLGIMFNGMDIYDEKVKLVEEIKGELKNYFDRYIDVIEMFSCDRIYLEEKLGIFVEAI